MCEEIEKMKKAERIKIAHRHFFRKIHLYFGENQDSDK